MTLITDLIPHFTLLFSNPYLFSLLGLLALAVIVVAFRILTRI